MDGGENRANASDGRELAGRLPLLLVLALSACWSWIGTAVPVAIGVLAGGEDAAGAASLALLATNLAMLVGCAAVRTLAESDAPPPVLPGAAVGVLALAAVATRLFAPQPAFGAVFVLLTIASSHVVMGCLVFSLDAVAQLGRPPIPTLASMFAISALANMAITLLPFEVRVFSGAVLACLACLLQNLVASAADPKPGQQPTRPCPPAVMATLARPAVGAFLYGLVIMGMWYISLGSSDAPSRDEATVVQSAAICLFFVVIAAVDRFGTARGRALLESALQRLVFAAYVVGTMLFSIVLQSSAIWSTLLVMSGTALFEMTLFHWAVAWGRSVSQRASLCLAVLLGGLMAGQIAAWWCLGGPAAQLLASVDPMAIGYACLALLLPAALAVFIPMDMAGQARGAGEKPAADGAPTAPDPFALFCDEYGFSPRESQVAELLAAGRSLPYIQDALAISEGTAKTHLRHIYDKTGTHRRQDFLSLVQEKTQSTSEDGQS